MEDMASDFIYLRPYSTKNHFHYFDNDAKVRAPADATSLIHKLVAQDLLH
jgi:hypothetical protein